MVFIDTPLDVALARRILRNVERGTGHTADENLHYVTGELSGYLVGARLINEHFRERIRASSDLILDGITSRLLLPPPVRRTIQRG